MKSELGVTFVSIVLTTLICLAFQLLTFSDKFGPQTQISSNLLGKNTFQSQINLKDTDFSRENCTNLLHDGFWRNPGAGEQINSYSFNGNRSMVWEPGKSVNCDWVVYTWPKMAQCFESASKTFNTSGSDRSILRVIGDSRGRQYFSAIHALLTGSDQIYDSVSSKKDNTLSIFNFTISQKWLNKLQTKTEKMKIYLKENSASAYLTIIPAMTLHPIFTSGFERTAQGFATIQNGTLQKENIDKEMILWRDFLMPLLQEEIVDSGKIFIIVLPEMIQPEVFEFDSRRNRLITEFGVFLGNLVGDSARHGRIFLMDVNLKTYVSMNGSFMLPDRIHLVKKDQVYRMPPALKVNVNLIMNVVCNRFLNKEPGVCCG